LHVQKQLPNHKLLIIDELGLATLSKTGAEAAARADLAATEAAPR
jgi:hypothetical protein